MFFMFFPAETSYCGCEVIDVAVKWALIWKPSTGTWWNNHKTETFWQNQIKAQWLLSPTLELWRFSQQWKLFHFVRERVTALSATDSHSIGTTLAESNHHQGWIKAEGQDWLRYQRVRLPIYTHKDIFFFHFSWYLLKHNSHVVAGARFEISSFISIMYLNRISFTMLTDSHKLSNSSLKNFLHVHTIVSYVINHCWIFYV